MTPPLPTKWPKVGIALRVLLLFVLCGTLISWAPIQIWTQLPVAAQTHLVVGAGSLRAVLVLLAAWAFFPAAFRASTRISGRVVKACFIAALIAMSIVAARVLAAEFGLISRWQWPSVSLTNLIYLLLFSVGTAVFEEVLFRFVLLDRGGAVVGTPLALLIQLAFFAWIHLLPQEHGLGRMLSISLAGLLISLVYLWTRSLWAVISLHMAHNALIGLTFGGSIAGASIFPMVYTDNFGKRYADIGAIVLLSAWSAFVALQLKRKRTP